MSSDQELISSEASSTSSNTSDHHEERPNNWLQEPWVVVRRAQQSPESAGNDDDGDDDGLLVNPNAADAEQDDILNPVEDTSFCSCRHSHPGAAVTPRCVDWKDNNMNTCCRDHEIWSTISDDEIGRIQCVCDSQSVQDLMREAPLRLMYRNYAANHTQRFPDAYTLVPNAVWPEERIEKTKNAQMRLAAYRSMIFWAFPNIQRKQRRPLPSCVYMMIRTQYPPTQNEEAFADTDFSHYIPEARDAE